MLLINLSEGRYLVNSHSELGLALSAMGTGKKRTDRLPLPWAHVPPKATDENTRAGCRTKPE